MADKDHIAFRARRDGDEALNHLQDQMQPKPERVATTQVPGDEDAGGKTEAPPDGHEDAVKHDEVDEWGGTIAGARGAVGRLGIAGEQVQRVAASVAGHGKKKKKPSTSFFFTQIVLFVRNSTVRKKRVPCLVTYFSPS